VIGRVLDELDRILDHFLARRADLRLDVFVRRRHDQRDAVDIAVECVVDIGSDPAGEAGDRRVEIEVGHAADAVAFALGGTGAAGLDHVDSGLVQRRGDIDLLIRCQRDTGGLLAVPKCRIQ